MKCQNNENNRIPCNFAIKCSFRWVASLSPDSIFSIIFSFHFKGIQSSTAYMIYSVMSLSGKGSKKNYSKTLSTLGKIFSRRYFEIFFPENKIWHFMQLSPKETICMKCHMLFSGKNKKNIINLSIKLSAENVQRVVKVKETFAIVSYRKW